MEGEYSYKYLNVRLKNREFREEEMKGLSNEELEDILGEVNLSLTMMSNRYDRAKANAAMSGQFMPIDDFLKLKGAKRLYHRLKVVIERELKSRKDKDKRRVAFLQEFYSTSKRVLAPEEFKAILEETKRVMDSD